MARCIAVGYPWAKTHGQTDRNSHWLFDEEYQELFIEGWDEFISHVDEVQNKVSPAEAPAEDDTKKDDTKKDDAKKDGKKRGKTKGAEDEEPVMKRPAADKTSAQKADPFTGPVPQCSKQLWAEAQKLKKLFKGIEGSTNQILEEIAHNAKWDWAANAQNRDKLIRVKEAAKAGLTTFHREFLSQQATKLLKAHDAAVVRRELTNLFDNRAAYKQLGDENSLMLERHQVELQQAVKKQKKT